MSRPSGMCAECPFHVDSSPGWLGESSGDPVEFLNSTCDGEAPLPCHMSVDWDADDAQDQAGQAPLCRGNLLFMANRLKCPRDPALSAHVPDEGSDQVFRTVGEFCEHHRPGCSVIQIGHRVMYTDPGC